MKPQVAQLFLFFTLMAVGNVAFASGFGWEYFQNQGSSFLAYGRNVAPEGQTLSVSDAAGSIFAISSNYPYPDTCYNGGVYKWTGPGVWADMGGRLARQISAPLDGNGTALWMITGQDSPHCLENQYDYVFSCNTGSCTTCTAGNPPTCSGGYCSSYGLPTCTQVGSISASSIA